MSQTNAGGMVNSANHRPEQSDLGPVVQSIISLTKLLVNNLFNLPAHIKSIVLKFFAGKKMRGAFSAEMSVFLHVICLKIMSG